MNKNLLRLIEQHSQPKTAFVNQYKRHDVFRCNQESHRHFNNTVSVYHVLKVKKCYPQGCTYFRWKCRKFNKGEPCHKKFKHVGRPCFSCKSFYDIKEINRPETILSFEQFKQFQAELNEFENWLYGLQGRQVDFSGIINSIKPRYFLQQSKYRHKVLLDGFLLNSCDCMINLNIFQDLVYLPVSIFMQNRYKFSKGDSLFFQGYFTVRDGAIIINKIRGIEIQDKAGDAFWTESRARVAQRTGSLLTYQSAQCHACDKGVLLRVAPGNAENRNGSRALFCLEGITDPSLCCYNLKKNLQQYECPHDGHSSAILYT